VKNTARRILTDPTVDGNTTYKDIGMSTTLHTTIWEE
jgi:hypothetical protein